MVDKSTLVTDVAIRGTLVRSVSAQGSFAPEFVRVASATQSGVVNEIFVKAGSVVQPGGRHRADAESGARRPGRDECALGACSSASEFADARQQAQASSSPAEQPLRREGPSANRRTSSAVVRELHNSGLLPDLQYRQAQIQAKKSADDLQNRRAQVNVAQSDAQAKVAAAQAQVEQAAAQVSAAQAEVAALTVRSATSGIVQSVDVDPGTSVAQNTEIARIADIHDLKVVLQVAESDVHPCRQACPRASTPATARCSGASLALRRPRKTAPSTSTLLSRARLPAGRPPRRERRRYRLSCRKFRTLFRSRALRARPTEAPCLFKIVDGGTRAVHVRVRLGQGSSDRVQVALRLALRATTSSFPTCPAYPDQTYELRLR